MILCLWLLCHSPMQKAYDRNVAVENAVGRASGVILETNLVLTNAHVVETIVDLKVGKETAVVLLVDPLHDLALLRTKTAHFKKLKFGKSKLADVVFYIGNPIGHFGSIAQGHLVWQDTEHLVTDTMHGPGMSGGGLYNSRGQLIGLNEGMEGQNGFGYLDSIHIPSEVIKVFLKEYR